MLLLFSVRFCYAFVFFSQVLPRFCCFCLGFAMLLLFSLRFCYVSVVWPLGFAQAPRSLKRPSPLPSE